MKNLIKIILSLSIFLSVIYAEDAKKEDYSYKFSEKDISEMNKIFKYKNKDEILKGLKEKFKKTTGDENYDKYLKEAFKDEDWKKANYLFEYKSYLGEIPYNGKMHKVRTPYYKAALEYFYKSSEKGNLISTVQGFIILEKYLMYFKQNPIAKRYLESFSKKLMEENYCVGYLYTARAQTKEYGKNPNYAEVYDLLKKGYKNCKKEGIEDFYITGMKHEKVKAKTLKRVQIAKEKKQGGLQ